MNKIKRPVNSHKAYHAHVYYEKETMSLAKTLCKKAGERFNLEIGRAHQKLVGPHPRWSCQILFATIDFDALIPWLESNRKGLSILVHAQTGNDLLDHTDNAYWLGDSIELNLSLFRESTT